MVYKKYYRLLFLFLFSVLFSCKENIKKSSDITDIVIDPSDIKESYDINEDYAGDIELIPLETTDESLIARISKVIFSNGKYYILDRKSSSVLLFDSKGKYLSKLSKKGQGPDEYTRLNSFTVVNDTLWVSDDNRRLLIGYDKDFKMIKRINLWEHISADHIAYSKEHILLADNWSGFKDKNIQLGMYDIKNDKVEGLLYVPKISNKVAMFKKPSQLSLYRGTDLFIYSYCDSIFQIEDHKAIPKYKLAFKERYKDLKYSIEEIMAPKNKDIIKGLQDIKQMGEYILLGYADNRKFVTAMYNKKNNKSQVYRHLTNSNYGNIKLYQYSCYIGDEYLISFYESNKFKKSIPNLDKIKNSEYKDRLNKVISSLKPDDNPVLVKFNAQ